MCSKDKRMSGVVTCSVATSTAYVKHATMVWSEEDGTFAEFDTCRVVVCHAVNEVGLDATTDLPPAQRRVMGLYALDLWHSARVRKDRRHHARGTCVLPRYLMRRRRCSDSGAKDMCCGICFTYQPVQTDMWGRW